MPNKMKLKGIFIRLFVFCASLSIASVVVISFCKWVYEGDRLTIRSFKVHETQQITSAEISEYLKDFLGKPLYGTSLKEVGARLSEHPLIAQAHINRIPPYEIEIILTQRKPIAVVDGAENLFLDESSHLYSFAYREKNTDLPKIAKKMDERLFIKASNAINSYAATKRLAGKITELKFDANDSISVLFSSGLNVRIGKDNFARKWENLATILNGVKEDEIPFSYIYLGNSPNPRHFAVKFK